MTIFEFLKNKKILVFGLGVQGGGVGDILWLNHHGFNVRGTDQSHHEYGELSGIPLTLGRHDAEDIAWADLIIKNPGVPDDHPLIQQALKAQKEVYSSIALFVKYCPIKTIGITGTRGKSTTTELTSQVLSSFYPNQIVTGGNIPGTSAFQLFDLLVDKKFVVLELSSFQLHSFHDLQVSPNYSLVTNFYPDHLNRYPNMASYAADKHAIAAYQTASDFLILNSDNEGSSAFAKIAKAPVTYFSANDVADWQSPLPGSHNRENIAAMWKLVNRLGVNEEVARKITSLFYGVPFRQEKIREVGGVTYINDTTATTPIAATKALQAQNHPTILICGGATKNLPIEIFLDEIKSNPHLSKIILLGSREIPEFTSALNTYAKEKILGQVNSMQDAVALASLHAQPGDVVLLSPGFASFDLFQNEFDRGHQFNNFVNKL